MEQPQGLVFLFRFDAMDLDLDDLEVAQSGGGDELLVTLLMNVKPIRMKPGDPDVVALCSCPIVSFHCSNVFQCFSIVLRRSTVSIFYTWSSMYRLGRLARNVEPISLHPLGEMTRWTSNTCLSDYHIHVDLLTIAEPPRRRTCWRRSLWH